MSYPKACFLTLIVFLFFYQAMGQFKRCKDPVLIVRDDYLIYNKDTLNKLDTKGHKQGVWINYQIMVDKIILEDSEEVCWWMDSIFCAEDSIYISETAYYTDDLKNGTWRGFYQNGSISYIAHFFKDELSVAHFYDRSGDIMFRVKKHGKNYVIRYRKTGKKKEIYTKEQVYGKFNWN